MRNPAPLPAGATSGPSSPGRRLVSLDGLRGLAALVVVLYHCLLTWPALAGQFMSENRGSRTWWLTFTPLRLPWAGPEAVVLFFVLSGLVLTLPYLERPASAGSWAGYYARRLLRLYVPVVVALALSWFLVSTFPRVPTPGMSWWFAAHAAPTTMGHVAHDALVLDGTSNNLNTVLWSLRYEVTFSLVLPFVVLALRRWPPRLWPNVALCLFLAAVGQLVANPFLDWMPFLALGAALAAGWDDVRALGRRIQASRGAGLLWSLIGAGAAVLLLARCWFGLELLTTTPLGNAAGWSSVGLGAVLLIFLAVCCPAVERCFSSRFLQWAGRISFSLYLVHEPIVVSVSAVAGPGTRGTAMAIVIGGAISLCVAVVFHRLVELPAQWWARAAGRRLDGRRPAVHDPVAVPVEDDDTLVLVLSRNVRLSLPRQPAARRPVLPPVPAPRGPTLPEASRRAPVPLESGR